MILLITCALAADTGAASVLISIDQTGANRPVDIDHPRTWNFSITEAGAGQLTVDRSLFGLKAGNYTIAPITFSLYSGFNGVVGNEISSVTLQSNQVDGFYTTYETFGFGPYTLGAGNYSATLTSSATDGGNTSYFLKTGKLALYTGSTSLITLVDPDLWIQDANSDGAALVPEPGRAALLLVGGTIALLHRRRKPASGLA